MSMQVPKTESREGAVLVADISGFTQLTETLSTAEAAGVEILTKCMNGVFGRVIDVVRRFRGDVTRFAGDSVHLRLLADGERAAPSRWRPR